MAAPAFQSLYRRYRPQRFEEVRGQSHLTRALRNSVRDGRVSHAYLFSGSRGTGKTSTARILAKALNCTDLQDGEPCCKCESCLRVQGGTSLDVHELDAASNNGVEAMRDLIQRAALGTPGRWKVYIVDEVHMLSNASENALLKTLEEPPPHVVFVLATTDPQKVGPTVKSRTQHFEFRLLAGDVLVGLVQDVNADAGLGVAPEAIELIVRRGRGSARDALSVLDQVAAAGEVEDDMSVSDELTEALCERDAGRALVAVAQACATGRDPRRLAEDLIEHLRAAFLLTMAPGLVELADDDRARLAAQAQRLGAAALVRALEAVGGAIADMKEALDPRISLEVALVRVARPDADVSPAALLERLERLERGQAGHGTEPARADTGRTVPPPPEAAASPAGGSRAALGALRRNPAPAAARQVDGPPDATDQGATTPTTAVPGEPSEQPSTEALPTREDLTIAWGDVVLKGLTGRAKARFSGGRFVAVEDGAAVFALPNETHRARCEEIRADVESVLATHFGVPVPLRLVVDERGPGSPSPAAAHEVDDAGDDEPDDLREAPPAVASVEDRLREAFPGAEEVSGE